MLTNTYFTADTHIGHQNIIKHCSRPFKDCKEMDTTIKDRINSKVGRCDTLIILGDVGWEGSTLQFLSDLDAGQIQIIYGNHDKEQRKKLASHKKVVWAGDVKQITIEDANENWNLWLSHYPHRSWPAKGRGGIHLFGHVHGRLANHDRSMDCGVDTNNFTPYSWFQIKERMGSLPFYSPVDPEGDWMGSNRFKPHIRVSDEEYYGLKTPDGPSINDINSYDSL